MNTKNKWRFQLVETPQVPSWLHLAPLLNQQWSLIYGLTNVEQNHHFFQYYLEFIANQNHQIVYLFNYQSDLKAFQNWFNSHPYLAKLATIKNQKIIFNTNLPVAKRKQKWASPTKVLTRKKGSILGYLFSLDDLESQNKIKLNWENVKYVTFENYQPGQINWINFFQIIRPFFNHKCYLDAHHQCQIHFDFQKCQQANDYYLLFFSNQSEFNQELLITSLDQDLNRLYPNQIDQSFVDQICKHWQQIQIVSLTTNNF